MPPTGHQHTREDEDEDEDEKKQRDTHCDPRGLGLDAVERLREREVVLPGVLVLHRQNQTRQHSARASRNITRGKRDTHLEERIDALAVGLGGEARERGLETTVSVCTAGP